MLSTFWHKGNSFEKNHVGSINNFLGASFFLWCNGQGRGSKCTPSSMELKTCTKPDASWECWANSLNSQQIHFESQDLINPNQTFWWDLLLNLIDWFWNIHNFLKCKTDPLVPGPPQTEAREWVVTAWTVLFRSEAEESPHFPLTLQEVSEQPSPLRWKKAGLSVDMDFIFWDILIRKGLVSKQHN